MKDACAPIIILLPMIFQARPSHQRVVSGIDECLAPSTGERGASLSESGAYDRHPRLSHAQAFSLKLLWNSSADHLSSMATNRSNARSNANGVDEIDALSYNAQELKLGPLFSNPDLATALTNVEVLALMKERKEQLNKEEREPDDLFFKTHKYLTDFDVPGVDLPKVQELRKWLEAFRDDGGQMLHSFEVASLINLLPAGSDEAITHIPKLKRFRALDIDRMLDELKKYLPDEDAPGNNEVNGISD